MKDTRQKQLGAVLWAIADRLRGAMNADDFRDYMLSFLFLRYLSDRYEAAVRKELGDDYLECEAEIQSRREDRSSYVAELNQIITDYCGGLSLEKLGLDEEERDQDTIQKARDRLTEEHQKMLFSDHVTPLAAWYIHNLDQIEMLEKQMRRKIHYVIKPAYLWSHISELAGKQNKKLLELLQSGFRYIENESFESSFRGLFSEVNLDSDKLGKSYQERNSLLCSIITEIAEGLSRFPDETDLLGDAYEFLIGQFAAGSGKKAGEFYTPQQVSTILSRIVTLDSQDPAAGKKSRIRNILDFACGSGSLLINVRRQLGENGIGQIYGQEKNITTYNLARMNMLLHGLKDTEFQIHHGDSLANDWDILKERNPAKKIEFDAVVANPPFSYRWEPDKDMATDFRFQGYGLAPRSAADFAFLLHGFHFLSSDGTMAIILPHGVLFRGGAEEKIRKKLLQQGSIDAVIGLPANLFFSTGIPVCILVLKKSRKFDDVLMINASEFFEKGKRQNTLLPAHIDRIVDTYRDRKEDRKYSRRISMKEIKNNGYNLNISRYVSTAPEEELIDMEETARELEEIEAEVKQAKSRHNEFLKELGLKPLP